MRLVAGAQTHQGQVRDNNEDAFVVDDQRALFAIADGMGGHRGGEVASHTAIDALQKNFASGMALADAIARANDAVIDKASSDVNLRGMGTTMTAVIPIGPRQLLIGHVGDSRAYLLHDGEIERITDDHSLVEEMVRQGRLTPEQAEAHPQRAIVTRALGVDTEVDVDTYTVDVDAGDRVILCSDGLTTMVRERDVERIAGSATDPQHAADALVAAANEAGGEDNITVVVVDVAEVDAPDPAAALPAAERAAAASVPAAAAAATPEVAATPLTPPAPEAPEPAPARPRGSRLRTVRGAILVLLPVILILGVATTALGVYARRSYYVGVDHNEVVIYKGVPGGVLGWDPTVDERTGIHLNQLAPIDRTQILGNTARGSLTGAHNYVDGLRGNLASASTTTTTRPRTTTTVRRRTTSTTRPKSRTTTTKPKATP